jgi:hypothetical protein
MSRATTVGQCEKDESLAEVLGVWKVVGAAAAGGAMWVGKEVVETKTVISRSFRDVGVVVGRMMA